MVEWLRRALEWFRRLLTRPVSAEHREASAKAVAWVVRETDCVEAGAKLRAEEPERWVFAVFYRPRLPTMPMPYRLVAVGKRSGTVTGLDSHEADPYLLRGYK